MFRRRCVVFCGVAVVACVAALPFVGGPDPLSLSATRTSTDAPDAPDGPREPRVPGRSQEPAAASALADSPLAASSRLTDSIENGAPRDRESTVPSEDPTAGLVQDMAAGAYAKVGERFVDYLVASGLSRADSERVIRRGLQDASRCSIDALREEAQAQSVSFDDVLAAVAAGVYESDGPFLTAVIDVERVRAREAPCLLNVFQQAGVPISVMEQLAR